MSIDRRLPIGAEIQAEGVHFRVWAPTAQHVAVVDPKGAKLADLQGEPGGYFAGLITGLGPGTLYRYQLDGGEAYPDPASRFQPEGPHGPSQVVDVASYTWLDSSWHGVSLRGAVISEMHIGTFTPEGTYTAAARELERLKDVGISVLEIMPVAEFVGRFGWGYDGVDLFAPYHHYGTPDDLKAFIDRAHALGIAVIHDVVYNHLGPDGCYLSKFAPDYFSNRYETEWGDPLNFDGPNSGSVREFFLANARYWIEEFHFDGLRLDATQSIFDASDKHILAEISEVVRSAAAGRDTLIIGENEPQQVRLLEPPARGGYGLDALWNDDYHHSAHVALTGNREAYYTDHIGSPQEFVSAAKYGFLYQGQHYLWQGKRRGTPSLRRDPKSFVTFIENHDQIANSGRGIRMQFLSHPGVYRAFTALTLLGPGTPMLFQGQEYGATQPFLYFADHQPELARVVAKGRLAFMQQFSNLADPSVPPYLPVPHEEETFRQCKLNPSDRTPDSPLYKLHRDLIRLKRSDAAFQRQETGAVDGAVLAQEAFVLRFFAEEDRLLIVNYGPSIHLSPMPEPLLAPPEGCTWEILWSSEHPAYGGSGITPFNTPQGVYLQGTCALVLHPVPDPAEK